MQKNIITFYITPTGAVWRESWPEIDFEMPSHVIKEQEKAIQHAIKSALPVEGFTVPDNAKAWSFVEVRGRVEVVYQRDFSSTFKETRFEDITKEAYENGHSPYAQRKIARFTPESAAQLDSAGDSIPGGHTQCPTCHGSGELVPDVDCRKCKGSGHVPDNAAIINPDATLFLEEQLAAANKRIAELENALADMITAPSTPSGLKARILEAFKEEWQNNHSLNPAHSLEDVLDELNIK